MYSRLHLSTSTWAGSRSSPRKLSNIRSPGLPGSIYNVLTPTALSQSLTTLAVNTRYLTGGIQGRPGPQTTLPTAPAHGDSSDINGYTFSAVLIQNGQQPESPPFLGALMHEVIAPDMVPMSRSQAHARAVMEPQSPAFRHGTFSPSCLQSLSTRLWFTFHPSQRSMAVILR